ncbi:class I SAM-dependent methyltransferase [bacterium]|nr:class I SAM-dependent methyltransferase [bacterium]
MTSKQDTINGFFCPSRILIDSNPDLNTKKGKISKAKLIAESGFYDWLAPHYDRLQPVMDPSRYQAHSIILDVLNAIEPVPGRILDIGCGTGLLTCQILELFPDAHVTAIDGSIAMLEEARANLEDFTDRITLAKADFRNS